MIFLLFHYIIIAAKTQEKRLSIYSIVSFLCWQRLTFPGSFPPSIISDAELNFCVRYGDRWTLCSIVTNSSLRTLFAFFFPSSAILTLPSFVNWIMQKICSSPFFTYLYILFSFCFWSSPRPISINQLNMSPCLHLWPIYHIVYVGSYLHYAMGDLILRGASRLDAFSVYPVRT